MLGAIIGDIAGSRFEWNNHKSKDFELLTYRCHLTDDSVMTLAIAKAVLNSISKGSDLAKEAVICMQDFGRKYPAAGYGGKFSRWLCSPNPQPYNSFGNGAAMRVSPCGFAAVTWSEAMSMARTVTAVTHNHAEGIKAAEAVTDAIFMARDGKSLLDIRDYIESKYYKIDFTLDSIRDSYSFDVTCQGSVPQAFEAFFESAGFEDAIRNAISIGGDSDTIAAITGAMAEAYYGIPDELRKHALTFLDPEQLEVLNAFETKFGIIVEKKTAKGYTRPVNYVQQIKSASREQQESIIEAIGSSSEDIRLKDSFLVTKNAWLAGKNRAFYALSEIK